MNTQEMSQPGGREKDRAVDGTLDIPSPSDDAVSPRNSENLHPDLLFAQSFSLTIDEEDGQLSSGQTNTPIELSIPRPIIKSSITSTIIHVELVRPIIAGTYNGDPAYLLRLQFQLVAPGSAKGLDSRIQNVDISALLEDAPVRKRGAVLKGLQWDRKRRPAQAEPEPKQPEFASTFPGPKGWEGPFPTSRELGPEVNGLGAHPGGDQRHSREELGTLKVTTVRKGWKGSKYNSLFVNVAEDPVQMTGVPSYLTIPLIIRHHSRRFSMRVSLDIGFGFWREKLAEMIPALGRADEPLFFDPTVMQQMMETEERGSGGVKVVEWGDKLEEVDLSTYSSFISDNH